MRNRRKEDRFTALLFPFAISLFFVLSVIPALAMDRMLVCDATLISADADARLLSVRVHGIQEHPMGTSGRIRDGYPDEMTVVLSASAGALPASITAGSRMRMWGRFAAADPSVFVAEVVRCRGCGGCEDPTGVRNRLGRGNHGWRHGRAGGGGCMRPFLEADTDTETTAGSASSGNSDASGGSGSGSSGGNGSGNGSGGNGSGSGGSGGGNGSGGKR